MEIDTYLERIGAERPDAPSPAALSQLQRQHLISVPFENLDIYRRVPLVLDEDHILDKLVNQRRGGICAELNTGFAWLLRNLGYRVSVLSGDVANGPNSFGRPGQHLLLLVDFGPDTPAYIANVGFGDGSLYAMPLVPDVVTEDRHARYRVVVSGDYWLVQRAPDGSDTYEPLYRFTTTPRSLADFADAVLWVQTSPESVWYKINCSRATPEGRVQLFGNRLIIMQSGKQTETWIRGAVAVNQALRKHFGITLPPAPG
jgi:N-hydroxyarylamine O-acetyltransferase